MKAAGPVCKVRPRCPPDELDPLIEHLVSNRPVEDRLAFPRGTMLADGRLDLCKQALGPEGMRRVAAAMAANTQVKHLLLGADQLGPEGAMVVAELAREHPKLETVYMGCNGIGPYGARALAEALRDNEQVRALWLKRNAVGPEGAVALARLLDDNERIETLDLVSNELGIDGIAALAPAVARHPGLRNLYLCGNQLGPEGAEIVAEMLAANRCLLRLYLATNEIGDRGCRAIAGAIPERLTALGLSSNEAGPEGARAIASAVRGHPSLEVLELGHAPATAILGVAPNRIGDDGARSFEPVVRAEGALIELDLAGNGIEDPGAAALIDALETNRRMTKLSVGGDLGAGLRRRLTGLLCRNANESARRPDPHTAAIKSVYRTARPPAESPVEAPAEEAETSPRFTDDERGFTDAELETCLTVLEAIAVRRDVLAAHPDLERLMVRVLRRKKQPKRKHGPAADHSLLEATGIRRRTGLSVEMTDQPRSLARARSCYVCKSSFTRLHHFYDSLCPSCADFNWQKRTQTADLSGRVALVTGGRIKIGFRVVLALLRAGAEVVATTRFPMDAARRYAEEPDFDEIAPRLRIHGLDLLHLPEVERFARSFGTSEPRLDILINNAAQTIYRPPAFYAELREREAPEQIPPSFARVLAPVLRASLPDRALFPEGSDDGHGQPIDLRSNNSWRARIHEVSTAELLSVHLVNAVGPYVLTANLRGIMSRTSGDKFVVNVSAMEGQFAKSNKTFFHPHTNMAKAAMNMLTRTAAEDLANDRIHMTSVDTGWITNENPYPVAEQMKRGGFTLPLDEIDGAARILDPVFSAANGGDIRSGCFLKDYRPVAW